MNSRIIKNTFLSLGLVLLLGILSFGGLLLFSTITDYKPPVQEDALVEGSGLETALSDSTYSFVIWNIGYGGLGKEVDFFYDGGETVRSPKEVYDKDIDGILTFSRSNDSLDFLLYQEVDRDSKRSYGIDQHKRILEQLPSYSSAFGMNYFVKFIPIPFTNPMGRVKGGLGSYTRYKATASTRHQFPGNYAWPNRIYFLDRCFMVQRFPLAWGKELLVINTHNSAYDDGGLKKQQMAFMKEFLLEEYKKGNYIVVGGDWNQCPPGFDVYKFKPEEQEEKQLTIAADFLPAGWQWVYDGNTPTNRKLSTPFDPANSFRTVIDFFLVSPNITPEAVMGIDQGFDFSDHQPVYMRIKLN